MTAPTYTDLLRWMFVVLPCIAIDAVPYRVCGSASNLSPQSPDQQRQGEHRENKHRVGKGHQLLG